MATTNNFKGKKTICGSDGDCSAGRMYDVWFKSRL